MNSQKTIALLVKCLEECGDARDLKLIVGRFLGAGDIRRVRDSNTAYWRGEYYLRMCLRAFGERVADSYRRMSEKGVKIAPEFVFSITRKDYNFWIIKVPGTSGRRLLVLPYAYALVDHDARQLAWAEIQRLADDGLLNRALQGSGNEFNWCVTPVSKQLMVLVWDLKQIESEEEKENYLREVHQTLFRDTAET